eukprot:PITA_08741
MEWTAPNNVDEVRSFMGLADYYRRFIRNFSCIAYPITSLQWKGKKFEWMVECEDSFEQLKWLLTHAPMLKIVDLDKEFVACTGACKRKLGGVIMQEGKEVRYESWKMNENENYPMHDLELASIIHALNERSQWVEAGHGDDKYMEIKHKLQQSIGKVTGDHNADYHFTANRLVRFRDRIYVPNCSDIKNITLREFDVKLYSEHLGYQKTLTTMKKFYYWSNLKKDVAEFVARCLEYQ